MEGSASKTPHGFLCEELLQPFTNNTDGSRTQMWSSHVTQAVIPENPETPRIFTRFENQIGAVSSAYWRAPADMRVMSVHAHPDMDEKLVFLLNLDDNRIEAVRIPRVVHMTENHGYRVIDESAGWSVRDVVPKGTVLWRAAMYDENLNLRYGVNLKAAYLSWENSTYEDGMVISESAAEKMAFASVDSLSFVMNPNEVLLNLYGDHETYRPFPAVGEPVREDGVLCALRRLDYGVVGSFSDAALRTIQPDDQAYHCAGVLEGVDVFSNMDGEAARSFEENACHGMIAEQLEVRNQFWHGVHSFLNSKRRSYRIDDAAARHLARSRLRFTQGKWRRDGREFTFLALRFTVSRRCPAGIGTKLTNRYGGKGVVSAILPDGEMPVAEDGTRPDILINPLCVVNRLIPSVLYEVELNQAANDVVAKALVSDGTPREKADAILGFVEDVNPEQAASMREALDDPAEFLAEVGERGLPLHQPPFHGNIGFDGLGNLFRKHGIKPKRFRRTENGVSMPIETPLMCGEAYMVSLKHHPIGKFSARSARQASITGLPTKTRENRDRLHPYSTTPVRVGEQELANLMAVDDDEGTLFDFLSLHSGSPVDRRAVIDGVLGSRDGFPDEFEATRQDGNREVLRSMMSAAGLEFRRTDREELPEMRALESLR